MPVVAYIPGSLTFSMQLMPYTRVIKLMLRNPRFIHQLIKRGISIIRAYSKLMEEAGATIFIVCEHDLQLIPPSLSKEFSMNYLPKLLDIFDFNVLHACGKVSPHLEYFSEDFKKIKNLNGINIGASVNITRVQELVDHEIAIAGNIDHVRLLPLGTPREVKLAVREAIKANKGLEGFIVAPECEITADTPVENVKALVRGARTCPYRETH